MVNERDFKIIVPVSSQGNINNIATSMSKHFGGVSVIPHIRGQWLDDKNKLVTDENMLMFSSRDSKDVKDYKGQLKKDRKFMKDLAKAIAKKLKQDSVWIEEDIVKDIIFVNNPKRGSVEEII